FTGRAAVANTLARARRARATRELGKAQAPDGFDECGEARILRQSRSLAARVRDADEACVIHVDGAGAMHQPCVEACRNRDRAFADMSDARRRHATPARACVPAWRRGELTTACRVHVIFAFAPSRD